MLIELQQHGHDQYIGWEMKVCCRDDDIVNRLEKQAKRMERDLRNWSDTILQRRNEFYHLNYFTTQQLLFLRKELGCFREACGNRHMKPEVMALLRGISREITLQNVRSEMKDNSARDNLILRGVKAGRAAFRGNPSPKTFFDKLRFGAKVSQKGLTDILICQFSLIYNFISAFHDDDSDEVDDSVDDTGHYFLFKKYIKLH